MHFVQLYTDRIGIGLIAEAEIPKQFKCLKVRSHGMRHVALRCGAVRQRNRCKHCQRIRLRQRL